MLRIPSVLHHSKHLKMMNTSAGNTELHCDTVLLLSSWLSFDILLSLMHIHLDIFLI